MDRSGSKSDNKQQQTTFQHECEQTRCPGLFNSFPNCCPQYLPDYLPFCPIVCPTANYLYLDLLKDLSSDNGLRCNLSKTNAMYKLKLMEDLCKINCAQDLNCCFFDSYVTKSKRKMCSHHKCLFYNHGLGCNSCSCSVLDQRVDGILTRCNQCRTQNNAEICPVSQSGHYHQYQCNCQNHKVPYCSKCLNIVVPKDPATLDVPERENPQTYCKENISKNVIKEHTPFVHPTKSLDEAIDEKQNENHCKPEGENDENRNDSSINSKTFIYSESVGEYLPNYMRGIGDKNSVCSITKLTVKHTSKQPLPQSTAYFLPF